MHKADVLSEALGNSRVWAPSPLRSTIDNGLNSGSVGASPTPGSFSRPCPISAQWGPERRRSVSVPMEPLLQLSSVKTGSHFSSFHPWSMGPELVPLQYCPFRGTIQAKPHTNTTLSSLPWDIKSNRETPAWASAVHVTQPEEASGRGWDYVEASESHLGHKSQGCTQCRVMQSNPRAVTTQLCHLVHHHPSLAFHFSTWFWRGWNRCSLRVSPALRDCSLWVSDMPKVKRMGTNFLGFYACSITY